MPRGRAASRPPVPAAAPAPLDLDSLSPPEADALRVLWLHGLFSGADGDGAPAPLYDFQLADRWLKARSGDPARDRPAADGDRTALATVMARLRSAGYVSDTGGRHATGPALSPRARSAILPAAMRWWNAAGVLLPPEAARAVEEHSPAEVATSFARFLAAADGMTVQTSGRPGLRDQQTLLRCFAVSGMDADGGWTSGEADAGPAGLWTAAPWTGYLPRLAPFVAFAAFEGLLLRGARRWVPDVDAWLDLGVAEQWARLAAGALRAARASPLGRVALDAASSGWVSPARLADWADRYLPGAGALHAFLAVGVAACAVSAGVGVLGRAGDEAVFTLTEAGRAVLQGRAPAVEPPAAEPLRVQPDFTVLAPLIDDPERAWALTGFAPLLRVDGAAMHRLERTAWTAARERGMDAEDTVLYLQEETGAGLPQNVAFTLAHDWSDTGGGAWLQPAALLRFASAEAAARARGAAALRRATLEELTPTVWRMTPGREAAVRKALQAAGVVCGDLAGEWVPETPEGAPAEGGAGGRGGRGGRQDAKTARKKPAQPAPAAPMEAEDGQEFRLPWPGPFGCPPPRTAAGDTAPEPHVAPLAGATPTRAVHMPPQALHRRLWSAWKSSETVWIDTQAEGIVRFRLTDVSRGGTVTGECLGCGRTHYLELDEIRGLLDAEAIAGQSPW